jgi:hypothetical protein
MTTIHRRGRLAVAGILAAAALGSAAPAQAAPADSPDRCATLLVQTEERFREIEERRGWYEASDWWNDYAWPKYYERCVAP